MRAILTAVALLAAAPASGQTFGYDRFDPARPQTRLELDRAARQSLDLNAELQRQSAQLNAAETRRLRTELLQQQIRTLEARIRVQESAPPALPSADRARIAADTAAEIGQIDRWLDGPR